MATVTTDLVWIPLDATEEGSTRARLGSEPFPPRDVEPFDRLTQSIREVGVLSPILARERNGQLQIICGFKRYLAAKAAGLDRIPALVRPLDDAEAIRCFHEESMFQRHAEAFDADVEEAWPASGERLARFPRTMESDLASPRATPDDAGVLDLTSQHEVARSEAARETLEEDSERVLVRSRAFFDEVRVVRSLNVPRTEILVDSILELIEGDVPLVVTGFSRPVEGDFTAPHSVLVTQLCARVARFLGWDEETSRNLVLGGFLHDVGMTFVRETASRASGSLSPADVRTIQSHTRIGCALIAGAGEWSVDIADMARDHHERWNGTGYPDGKKGTDIPFLARLLGLLDTYVALVTPRPHRPALDEEYARERLFGALQKGLWDPSLSPILTEALPRWALRGADREVRSQPTALTRNSVELRGDLATMLAKGST